jgi:hypothetical protein
MTTHKPPTIIDVIRNRQLFGSLPAFRDPSTWASWLVWLKAVFALPMSADELVIYRQCTGRNDPPAMEPAEAYTIVGRRGEVLCERHDGRGLSPALGSIANIQTPVSRP